MALELEGVAKRFGSLKVLEGIDLRARGGELVGLIGPNGAGKTTLMRCIADGAERSEGRVELCGHAVRRDDPARCVRYGLGRKFQNANVFDTMTVAESLRIATTLREWPSWRRRAPSLALPSYVLEVLRMTGLDQRLDSVARDLSHGQQPALELAMVLALEPRVILLDEPTAGRSKAERTQIGVVLSSLARRHGLCCLLVEHDLDFVAGSRRVVVLHQGASSWTAASAKWRNPNWCGPSTRAGAVGARSGTMKSVARPCAWKACPAATRPPWCSTTCRCRFRGDACAALLGKNGMGKSTLLKTVMGYLPKLRGRVRVGEVDATRLRPHEVARCGVAYAGPKTPLLRSQHPRQSAPGPGPRQPVRRALRRDRRAVPMFASRLRQHAGTLSGGEQQMLLVARGLMQRPAFHAGRDHRRVAAFGDRAAGRRPQLGARAARRQHVHRGAERGLRPGGRQIPGAQAGRHRR